MKLLPVQEYRYLSLVYGVDRKICHEGHWSASRGLLSGAKQWSRAGLEKSSVLPVLDRFLSLKTDFVLSRKQINRSIKIRGFFFSPILKTVYNSYLWRQFTVNFTPFNTLSGLIRLYTHMYYMTSGCHQLITPMSEWIGSIHFTQHVGLKDWSVFVAFFWQLAT